MTRPEGLSDEQGMVSDPVQRYLEGVADPGRRAALDHIRAILLQDAPDAEPTTSYGLPAFRDAETGGILLGFAATARGCSLYPFSGSVVAHLGPRLDGFSSTKGSIHFTAAHPLPDALIHEVVRLRRAEIRDRGR